MKCCRSKIKELERKLELCQDLLACYKGDRDLYKPYFERFRIAESLLTEDQRFEYYRLIAEHEEA